MIDAGVGATYHLKTFFGLVVEHVDNFGDIAQVLAETADLRVKTAKYKTAVGLNFGDFSEVVVCQVFVFRETFVHARHVFEVAIQIKTPVVVGAGKPRRLVALLGAAQGGALVGTGIQEAIHLARFITNDDDRLATHGGGEKIADLGDLIFVTEINPVALEDVAHLHVKNFRAGERDPFDARFFGFLVVFNK